jgi:predicted GH43/DUF377 family glycosyl hydrolase
MAIFPERIEGKAAAVLTVHTDMPPAKIALALFDDEQDLWSPDYWDEWYASLDRHVIPLLRSPADQVEVGAGPVWTEDGWLLVHSYIREYLGDADRRVFGIEAVLLDGSDPSRIEGRTQEPLLVPEAPYERRGMVENIAFPSSALIRDGRLHVYYGAADTSVALASVDLEELLDEMRPRPRMPVASSGDPARLVRYEANPIIEPRPEVDWEDALTFNPSAVSAP